MNSVERKERRYQRRKEKREIKNRMRRDQYASLDTAFSFSKVMYYADQCCKGVGFKKSTQNFKLHMFTIVATTCRDIKQHRYHVGDTYRFVINERGKIRNIDAPHIKDRLVHKVLSNEIILPIYQPHLIYDNGASMKDKGFLFAIKRVKQKLYSWYLKNGMNGYVVTIDFSKFFPNCSHDIIEEIHLKYMENSDVTDVIEDYLFVGDKPGIALGVEIAQREAAMIPNRLDHLIQSYACPMVRYMDDTFFIAKTKEEAEMILKEYGLMAQSLKIKINMSKTKITPLGEWFLYCKWKYKLLESGKILCIPSKDTIYRQRRKLRRMYRLLFINRCRMEEIDVTRVSFCAYLNIGNSDKYQRYLQMMK